MKNKLGNFLAVSLVFLIVTGWLFSGWPKAQAQTIIDLLPNAKHVNDDTTDTLSGVTGDDSVSENPDILSAVDTGDNVYTVDKNTTMQFDTFDVSSISDGSTISAVVLHLQYGAEDGYSGNNSVRYDNGGGLTTIGINPTDIAGWSADLTFDLYAAGVDTKTEIQNVDIEFTNNDGGGRDAIHFDYVWITVTYTPPVVGTITVGATGTQTATMDIPSTNNYVGGAFTLIRDSGTADVTEIIITDTGTVNANLNLSNVDLYYETAAVCSFEGTETLFGTAASFDASEKATVMDTMSVGTSQVCVYVVLDVGSGTADGQTIEIEISNPSVEVTVSSGTVTPTTSVEIPGTTTLQVPVVPPATWKADEDTTATATTTEIFRLRIGVGNSGSEASNYDYLLEYATKSEPICGDDETFYAVPITAITEPLEMATSSYVANGDPTTNATKLSTPIGYTFISGKIIADPSNSSGSFNLGTNQYTHFEFVLTANTTGTYCFRLTNAGTPLDDYPVYPELQIVP